jgi:hypothetical protein
MNHPSDPTTAFASSSNESFWGKAKAQSGYLTLVMMANNVLGK